MYRLVSLPISFFICFILAAQDRYELIYLDSSQSTVAVFIRPASPATNPAFIMPRSIPGHYSIVDYDKFVKNIYAVSIDGVKQPMQKDENDAPRWYCRDTTKKIARVEYEVDLGHMERQKPPGDASIIRPGFAGLLNYSIFGWIDGREKEPVRCTVSTFGTWPVFSTNEPSASPRAGSFSFDTDNYYALADGQIFIGPQIRVKEYQGIVPLFIVSYCQHRDEYLDDYGKQGMISMGILKDYFGEIPFKHYSIMLRRSIPLEPVSAPALAMEHLQSSTFFGDSSGVRLASMTQERIMQTIPTYLHHMAHAFIPLRSYGDTYRPYVQEIPPIMNNIWFNEGFMWFLPYDTLKLEGMKVRFYANVYNTSPLIKKMTLRQLSQAASTMYGADFRLGRAVYSRGAMMAIEMNNYIREKTGGRKSMRDVFRYLYNWGKENKRAFTMEELPLLLNKASGLDLSGIYEKWQKPIE